MDILEAKKFAIEIDNNLQSIDLHLCRLDEIEAKVDQFLCQCVDKKLSGAKIITGIGKGVIKNIVIGYLHGRFSPDDIIVKNGEIIVVL